MAEENQTSETTGKEDNSKFPNWKNPPTIRDLQQNLQDVDANSNLHELNVDRWLSNLYITGPAKPKKVKGSSSVQPKLIRKQAEWRYAGLSEPFLATEDLFNVNPITAGDKKRANQNELVLNNQFNTKIRKVRFIDSYIRDLVDVGTSVVKVGWETEEEEIEKEVPIFEFILENTGQLAQRYSILLQMKQANDEEYYNVIQPGEEEALEEFQKTGLAYIPQDTGETETITSIVETKNQPTVETVDSRNMVIDPSCLGDYTKVEFMAEKFKSSKSDLKKDGNYVNLDKINIEAASPIASPDYDSFPDSSNIRNDNNNFNFVDKPRKQFIVHAYWGMWDIDDTGMTKPIIVAWVGDTIIRMEENPFPDRKPPFVIANYMPVRKSVFGEPDGELLEDNQKINGAVTRGMIDLLGKSANSQTGVRKDLLDVVNKRKFNNGDDYEFNANVDPRQGVFMHTYPEIPQSAYNMVTMQNNEAESLSGVKAFSSSGISGDSLGRNVGNAKGAMDAASKREAGILRRVKEGVVDIGRKFISMNAEFLSEEEVIRITADEFVTVRRDDLEGNFDLQVDISTPEADAEKAQELSFMLQTNGPNDDPGEKRIIRAEIARLRKMPKLAKQIAEYKPEPDPLAVMKAQLDIKLVESEIAKNVALTAKHNAEAALGGARTHEAGTQGDLNIAKQGTEAAKSRQMGSDSDNKDLDFVNKQSGRTHAEDIDKIEKKGQVDNEGKVVDAVLTNNDNQPTQ